MPANDLTGQQFSRLTVISRAGSDKHKKALWLCQCSCGTQATVGGALLRNGKTRSCGCLRRELSHRQKHGHATNGISPEYRVWAGMKGRCRNNSNTGFHKYGAKGIALDPRWDDFTNFLADMGERPSPKHSIERIDNDKGYSPDNCKWALPEEQCRNRSDNRWLGTPKGRMTLFDAARAFDLHPRTISSRIDRSGWPVHKALTTPARKRPA